MRTLSPSQAAGQHGRCRQAWSWGAPAPSVPDRLMVQWSSCPYSCPISAGTGWCCTASAPGSAQLLPGPGEAVWQQDCASVRLNQTNKEPRPAPRPWHVPLSQTLHSPTLQWTCSERYAGRKLTLPNEQTKTWQCFCQISSLHHFSQALVLQQPAKGQGMQCAISWVPFW